ncbi:hypothetical protein [Streptomyces sp. TS71-3]|uniref:hypothetical protein n=1 Tax=Streptomyces sp. TS71-3 TaxID=2733862 RepID=UPI001AFFF251|nr:hypothetical protein [Streptomyces sp. TS71-3]GHJ35358.1 hypothetical protein Sm713_09670 [Streptomyces sp. TS71-3]
MSMRHVRHLRRAGAATLMAAALALTATACGGDDAKDQPSASASSQGGGQDQDNGGGNSDAGASEPLATVHGDGGIDMVIQDAKRDSGGFLTVNGEFKNTSGTSFTTPVQWSGQETDVKATGPSLAGMTLVDSKGKKRYYVLRDTDNRPLTTSDYASSIEAGKSLVFFAQFPAPPESTTSVDLQFPGFPNATIEIS